VSDRRVLEEQLAHAQKLEAIGEMTGGVAHDFNNMLSVIMGSLERVLSRPIEDDKTRSRLDLALQAANSCADLTKRLLGFARRQALDPKPTSIADELARLHDMVARLLGKAIKVEIACQDGSVAGLCRRLAARGRHHQSRHQRPRRDARGRQAAHLVEKPSPAATAPSGGSG
jgi:signal transduction histidine kinase